MKTTEFGLSGLFVLAMLSNAFGLLGKAPGEMVQMMELGCAALVTIAYAITRGSVKREAIENKDDIRPLPISPSQPRPHHPGAFDIER